eukprot:m.29954 g.29954  ORF g.29954 m.29954 type:complete len:90 (-) comp16187_c0_seq1:248-517(-)
MMGCDSLGFVIVVCVFGVLAFVSVFVFAFVFAFAWVLLVFWQYDGGVHTEVSAGVTPGSYLITSCTAPSMPNLQRTARPVLMSAQYVKS